MALAILLIGTLAAQAAPNGGGGAGPDPCSQRAEDNYNATLSDCNDPGNGATTNSLFVLCLSHAADHLQSDLEACNSKSSLIRNRSQLFGGKATVILGGAEDSGKGKKHKTDLVSHRQGGDVLAIK